MKLDKDALLNKLAPLVGAIKRYHVFMFIVLFLGLYGFLVIRVSSLTQSEPGPTATSSETETVKRLKLDKESVDKLLELEAQNIQVKSLFERARSNPFTE